MSQPERSSRMAVLLFTDMVDSVALERRLGTEAYSRLLEQHHRLFLDVLKSVPGGEVRNDTGDGILCEFHTSAGAVNAALLFQMALREADWELETPKVRIGIHQGQLAEFQVNTKAPGKLVGMPVNIAARVMSLAQAGQILMTRPVHDDARQFVRAHPVFKPGDRSPALKWKAHGQYVLKGSDDAVDVFEVGAAGFAPLTAPHSTEKARSAGEAPRPAAPVSAPRSALAIVGKHASLIGAALTAACGLALWALPVGESWVNASYDYLFRFGERTVTNKLALVLMDDAARHNLQQPYERPWDRRWHTELLKKLKADGCPLVVFDTFFEDAGEPATDAALAEAMRQHGRVVLATRLTDPAHRGLGWAEVVPLQERFRKAAASTGVGKSDAQNFRDTARRHWPFPVSDEEEIQSLPWAAAKLAGAELSKEEVKPWLRYYAEKGGWERISYHLALSNAPGFFRAKTVFIGREPESRNDPDHEEEDKFRAPRTHWNSQAVGGVEIMATTFLNLVNDDWLRRPAWPVEALVFVATGTLLGGGLCRLRPRAAFGAAIGAALVFVITGVCLSYVTNYWVPWLIVVGGQVPCALAWALFPARVATAAPSPGEEPASVAAPGEMASEKSSADEPVPDVPEYDLITPHIGEGGFGKVWLVRSAVGQWQALKAVYQSKFGENREPYEAEFRGLQNYKPVSEKHPGLLRIELVSKMKDAGYFYYVMELGDAQAPGWENQPSLYKPKDLEFLRKQAYKRRLPSVECLRIVTVLADALNFLHSQGLTHRDIKPSNVIFVNGRPKLADVGLVAAIRPPDQVHSFVGTLGYVPPPPEPPGTPQADIYSLGMLLYVISAGREPAAFPDLSTTLMERSGHAEFVRLNRVILKACQPNLAERYQTTREMLSDLQAVGNEMGC